MGNRVEDLSRRDGVLSELQTDLYIVRWHLQRMREMYVKHLGGQWLCEGCGEAQAASTPSLKTDDGLVHLCAACYRAVAEDAKRNHLEARKRARKLARKGRLQ